MKGKHLLAIHDLSAEEIDSILNLADRLKSETKEGKSHEILHGKTLGMIFAKPSTRTRVSFETGMTQLGGHAIYLGMNDLQLGRGETIADTARTLSRYVDAIMARLFKHQDAEELAKHSRVPVINGLTDLHHPCQALADLMTIREKFGKLSGINVAWVGDGNNVCISLMEGCSLVGANFRAACPRGYEPPAEIASWAKNRAAKSGSLVEIETDPEKAVKGADVIYTDVWVSMGQEAEAKTRLEVFKKYQVNEQLVEKASPNVIVMHCLPAHRGQEITDEVIDGPHSAVWDQAENRMHAQKALLVALIKGLP
ncbi:MAG: ornithine carbamoyltransferase [Candidatus Hadarchaeum sp.]|uniref:ornithine carbamoyltransferase n=1 Tax=Candidatus Hadarchaeum sp. TaxID=2883567 RepID=UPI003D109D00